MFDDMIKKSDCWEQFQVDFEEALKDVEEIESIEQFIEIIDKYLETIKCTEKIV